ncbi:hypothetical protein Tco_0975848 [Tanacetum coccineum]|uniref:Reverse transcriptase zinc-binding domain-containing protein n=1 Tax=Tanacetum coccineum TaxID=301880 RepID=A0ABQ5EFS2_9ASTR
MVVPNISQEGEDKIIWVDKDGKPTMFTMKNWEVVNLGQIKKWGNYDMMTMMTCSINSPSWSTTIDFLTDKPCLNSIRSRIRRLCLGAAVYFIWQERNFRIFRNLKRDWSTVLQLICDAIKLRLMGLQVKKYSVVDTATAICPFELQKGPNSLTSQWDVSLRNSLPMSDAMNMEM